MNDDRPPIPTPLPNPDNAGFWEGCRRGELRLQRCRDCGAHRHHPRPMCPACQSFAYDWVRSSGRGTIYSFTIAHRPTLPAFEERLPYNVIVVELEEGVFIVSNLVDGPPEIGLRVAVVFEPLNDEIVLPKFKRLSD